MRSAHPEFVRQATPIPGRPSRRTIAGKVAGALLCGLCSSLLPLLAATPPAPEDRLAAEIARWSAFLADHPSSGADWTQIKEGSAPILDKAAEALRDGRRLLALQRLAAVRMNLAAADYRDRQGAERVKDLAAFEAEWTRLGDVLRSDLTPPSPGALARVQPAAIRAAGEAVLLEVREYYEASLEYGRNTMPDAGFFYLGAAQAQKDFAAFCRTLTDAATRHAPSLRSLRPEIDALQSDLLATYRPPVSIDRHREFITASSTLKEARELDAAGLRYGALLRYLEAALRTDPLRPDRPAPAEATLAAQIGEFETRLAAGNVDHSIGRMLLEAAQANFPGVAKDANPGISAAIVTDVLPRYFAALGPPPPEPHRPHPEVTVTLVRWPYT
jgi:hypothetical protein